MKHWRQRGIALLVAIVMFAIATTVAAAITYSKAMAARRAAATFTMEQALQAGMAAEALASIALEDDANNAKTTTNKNWAMPLGPVEIEGTGIWIQAQLEDLTARFNLNSLVRWSGPPDNLLITDTHQLDVFRELLGSLDIDARYADLLLDWIDPDNQPSAVQGGEDNLYLTQSPPYRPPNTFINHTSELLALPGFGPEAYQKLAPYVTALPLSAAVNVCTASGKVLDKTLSDPLSTTAFEPEDLVAKRKNGCWPTKTQFVDSASSAQIKTAIQDRVAEKSSWFRLRTQIRVGTAEFVLYSVLYRQNDNKIRPVQRSFGSE